MDSHSPRSAASSVSKPVGPWSFLFLFSSRAHCSKYFTWRWRWSLGPGPDGHQQPCDLNKLLPLCGLQPSQPPNKDVGPLNDVLHICHSVHGMAQISHVSWEMERGRKFKGGEERAQCDHSWVKQSVYLLLSYFLYLEPSMLVNPPFHSLHPCHGFTCC